MALAPGRPARGLHSNDPLERILLRSRSAARQLFSRFGVPPAVAQRLLDTSLPTLESARGTVPGSSHRLLEALASGCRRFRDRSGPSASALSEELYDPVFQAVTDAIRRRAQRRRDEDAAARLASELLAEKLDAGQDPVEYSWETEECSAALAEQLLDRCREIWSSRREQAEQSAKAAITMLSVLASCSSGGLDHESPGVINDLTARAWTYVGNIRRQRGDLRGAEKAFAAASAYLEQGSLHPLERAQALVTESALRRDQGRYFQALRLLQQAAAIYRWAGDRHSEGGVYQRMATAHAYSGKPRLAIPLSERALKLIDKDQHPGLFASAFQNFAVLLCDVDRYADARKILPEVQRLFDLHAKSEYDRLVVQWLEARILSGEGCTGPALAILESLRERYLALDRPHDAALVSLELVAEYLELGQPQKARELAAQALPVLQALEVERETLAALVALRQATELETATVGWVRGVISSLRRPGPRAPRVATKPS